MIGLECFVATEAFIQRQSRRKVEKEADDVSELKHSPTKDEINGVRIFLLSLNLEYPCFGVHFYSEINLRLGSLSKEWPRMSGTIAFIPRVNHEIGIHRRPCR